MVAVYEKLLCHVLSWAEPLADAIPIKIKNRLLSVIIAALTLCSFFYSCVPVSVHLLIKCVIGSSLLVLLIFFSISGKIEVVSWDKRIVSLWLVFGLLRLLTGIVTSIEYLPLACVWLILFPMLFLVWNNRRDYETLYDSMYKGFVYPIVGMVIVSLAVMPVSGEAFGGLTRNANGIGQYICVAVPLILCKCNQKGISNKQKALQILLLGILFSTVFYSRSRTTTLVLGVTMLMWFGYKKVILEEQWRVILKTAVILVVTGCVLCYTILQVNGVLHIKEGQNINMEEMVGGYVERIEGNDKHAGGVENYSSGRTGIWKTVVQSMNMLGHPSKEHIVTERNGDVGVNVHNNFLQFAYDHGIFGGILFFILYCMATLKIMYLVHKRASNCELVLYNSVAFGTMSLVTSINLPFLYIITCSYYMCCAILFEKK